jgi:WD40 repeat protein
LTNAPSDEVTFLDNGNKLITASLSPFLYHEWDLATGSEIQSWQNPSQSDDERHAAGSSPDEQLFVALGNEGDVVARNLANKKDLTLPLDIPEGFGVAFSPDGQLFAAASGMGYARVWDMKTWRDVTTLHRQAFSAVFSPDGKRLATSGPRPPTLYDTDSWQELIALEGSGINFIQTAFSPDGNRVGAMSVFGVLHLWRAPSWAEINLAEAKDKIEAQQP